MKPKSPLYNSSCLDLAELFLADEPKLRSRAVELAIAIQDCVEQWIDYEKTERLDAGARDAVKPKTED